MKALVLLTSILFTFKVFAAQGYSDIYHPLSVAKGDASGITMFDKFGHNEDVDTGTVPEDVWDGGGVYTFPAAATVVGVASSSANDDGDPAGTGCQTVYIEGLAATTYKLINETVTLNGVGTVNTTQSFIRINRAYCTASGSVGTNDGNITLTVNSGTAAFIEAGHGQTLQSVYTVPAGKTLYISDWAITAGKTTTTSIDISGEIRLFGSNTWRIIRYMYIHSQGGPFIRHFNPWIVIPEKTDLRVRVRAVGSNNTGVASDYAGVLIDN